MPAATEEKPQVFETAPPTANFAKTSMVDAPDPSELIAFSACCCCITSCYCVAPKCISGYSKGVFMCFEIESLLCQPGQREGSLCTCFRGEVECIRPYTCAKISQQICCCDMRCAFPCDEEVPCMVTLYGLTCFKDYAFKPGCCVRLAPKTDETGQSPMLSRP